MVEAQLVEWLLLILEVHCLNPVIGKNYIEHLFSVNCIEKTKIKKERPGMAHFLKKVIKFITSALFLALKNNNFVCVGYTV